MLLIEFSFQSILEVVEGDVVVACRVASEEAGRVEARVAVVVAQTDEDTTEGAATGEAADAVVEEEEVGIKAKEEEIAVGAAMDLGEDRGDAVTAVPNVVAVKRSTLWLFV